MTAMIEMNPVREHARAVRTVDVAGVAWPAHKLQAIAVAGVVGLISLLVLTPELTAWLSGVALVTTWLVARHLPGNAATAPASNPPGIS
ncbi:hypothetical protein [Gordonia polyisoprenivorans]|uniref:hypothetical protein n=1 Tax=Gordonia polyisoprenivorans TaxID=84595 RepID=UPI002300B98A|nr:hypothetical protein [Gordonia polyisoprenivorans]WCB35434.1 hypothetical protein PHA63_15010 [Gordonia polyisoprenivorans]